MHIKRIIGLIVLFIVVYPVISFSEDQNLSVSAAMRKIQDEVRNINKAFKNSDYFTTATHFMELAKWFKSLDSVDPGKGTKAEWDRIHEEIIKEFFIAIGACAVEDDEIISASLKKIMALQKEGHGLFR